MGRRPFSPPASGSPTSEDERSFLQHRVSRFGLLVGLIFLGFAVFRLSVTSAAGHLDQLFRPNFYWHLVSTAFFLATWVITRRGALSARAVRIVETVGLLGGGAATQFMALDIPNIARPDQIMYMAMNITFLGRAIYVPSTARRTLVLGVILGLDMMGTAYKAASDLDMSKWAVIDTEFASHTSAEIASFSALGIAAWWTATLTIAVSTSAVIYGLRREVRNIRQLGQYLLREKIGEGGMGTVYRAHHALLARETAVKLLPPEKAGKESLERFEREVRLTASLNHPNTVTVFDFGHTPEGVFYYAMELIHGATLQDVVGHTGPMPAARVVHILEQVAGALVEAHGVGLIHRDIKPANIMLKMPHAYGGVNELAKVVDFGLVKDLEKGDPGLTRADSVTGTPHYLSPEAISDPNSVGPLSDIYALGAVAYFALTGQEVFAATSVVEVCSHHLHSQPVDPRHRTGHAIPESVVAVVMACLAKSGADRPQGALDLQTRLAHCAHELPWSPESARTWWDENRSHLMAAHPAAERDGQELTVDISRVGVA